jgi:arsenite methyltransferase
MIRDRMNAWAASQLGQPHGWAGPLFGVLLNRSNRKTIKGAVAALALEPGDVAADLGFGGGVGLGQLLDRVGPAGKVHGVDLSAVMVDRARRRFHSEVAAGRLALRKGTITQLPLEDRSIDGAMTVNTVYFIAELDRAFAELARVLKPNGAGVVGIGDPGALARLSFTAYGFRLRPVDELIGVAASAGLDLRDHQRVGDGEDAAHLLVFSPAPR